MIHGDDDENNIINKDGDGEDDVEDEENDEDDDNDDKDDETEDDDTPSVRKTVTLISQFPAFLIWNLTESHTPRCHYS